MSQSLTPEVIKTVPKVLLHDHLDGGVRPATVAALAKEFGYNNLPTTDPIELAKWFRDTVLLKVYGKISYLEFYGDDIWSFFKIDKEWINSIHIQVSNSEYELPKQIDEILTHPEKFKVHKGKKKLVNFKEDEVHQLVLKGCFVGTEDSWHAIENLLK